MSVIIFIGISVQAAYTAVIQAASTAPKAMITSQEAASL